jgi:hypothetical protein
MWNGKTFPLSSSTEKNLKAVIFKGQPHLSYPSNLKFVDTVKLSPACASKISIEMELLMQKKCVARHST